MSHIPHRPVLHEDIWLSNRRGWLDRRLKSCLRKHRLEEIKAAYQQSRDPRF